MEKAIEVTEEKGLTEIDRTDKSRAMQIEELESAPVKGEANLIQKDLDDNFRVPPGRLDLKQMEEMERQILAQQRELKERQERRKQK